MVSQIERGDEATTVTTLTTQLSGFRKLPQRLLFNIADFSRSLWWSTCAIIPATLLTIAVFVGDGSSYFYSMYCAVMMMFLSQSSERFINTTIEFAQDAGELVTTYHLGDPTLFRSDQEATVSLEDVGTARFLSLTGQTMIRLYYQKSFTAKPTAFLIPPGKDWQFREFIQRHNISIRGEAGADSTGWVWGRYVVTALLLGVIPVCGVFIWPVQYSWGVLLALTVNSIFLLRQGW